MTQATLREAAERIKEQHLSPVNIDLYCRDAWLLATAVLTASDAPPPTEHDCIALGLEIKALRQENEAIRAAALEEAAKVAEEWADRADRLLTGEPADRAHQAATAIANRIRALAGKPLPASDGIDS